MGELQTVQSMMQKGLQDIPKAYIRPVHERPCNGHLKDFSSIPVIDLSGLEDDRRAETMAQIGRACEEWGFFQVIKHGVPLSLMARVKQMSKEFLALPDEEKAAYVVKPGSGYEGYGSKMILAQDVSVDWRDYLLLFTLPESARQYSLWPPRFRETLDEYSAETHKLTTRLLAAVSENLGLPPSYMESAVGKIHQNFVINHYPPCPQPELALGLVKHSDLGVITLLMQDDVGLQVCKNEDWVSIMPLAEAIVVNVADQLEVLSNGKYRSVEHRAVVNREKARISIAMFHDPLPDSLVCPAAELIDHDHPRLYKDIIFEEYRNAFVTHGPDGKNRIRCQPAGE